MRGLSGSKFPLYPCAPSDVMSVAGDVGVQESVAESRTGILTRVRIGALKNSGYCCEKLGKTEDALSYFALVCVTRLVSSLSAWGLLK